VDLTIGEVATRLDRHPDLVRRWIRSGALPAYKIGTYWFVKEEDLAAFPEPARKPWKLANKSDEEDEG
jgi:excisionase family DNA binding protein